MIQCGIYVMLVSLEKIGEWQYTSHSVNTGRMMKIVKWVKFC